MRRRSGGLRILVLAPQPFFQHRGTPIAVRALLETLGGMGHEVHALVYHEGSDVEIPGCTVHRIPPPPGVRNVPPGPSTKKLVCDLFMLREGFRLARNRRFDLLHGVEEGALMALLLRRTLGVPYIYDMDSSLPEQLVGRYPSLRAAGALLSALERRMVRGSVGVMAVCPRLEAAARAHDPDVLVAEVKDFSLLDGRHRGSERIADTVGRSGPFALYVGNLESYQGIDLLLEGFSRSLSCGNPADLVVIGGSADHIRSYEERAASLGIADRVHFLGPRPLEMLGWYLRQAEVLVSPRIRGTNTPMKIYSYLDSRVAVLATRIPSHTQVLDEEIAVLAEPEPEAFGRELAALFASPSSRRRLGAAARRRAEREHSREVFTRKLEEFYGAVAREIGASGCSGGAP